MGLVVRLVALLLLVPLLAGCSGAGDVDTPQPSANPRLGSITGLVTDAAIRPLAANVTLLPTNQTTVAAADGSFRFDQVAVGAYLVQATLTGYLGTQVSTAVVEGQDSPVALTLSLIPDDTPYPVTVEFEGYIEASTGLLGAGGAALPPPASQCRCSFRATPEPGVSRLVLEAAWTDWVADPTGPTEFIWQVEALGANATAQGTSPTPLHQVLGSLDFPAQDFRLGNATAFEVRIYPDAVWPAVSQTYQAFLTFWYRGPPPEGWSLLEEP